MVWSLACRHLQTNRANSPKIGVEKKKCRLAFIGIPNLDLWQIAGLLEFLGNDEVSPRDLSPRNDSSIFFVALSLWANLLRLSAGPGYQVHWPPAKVGRSHWSWTNTFLKALKDRSVPTNNLKLQFAACWVRFLWTPKNLCCSNDKNKKTVLRASGFKWISFQDI